MLHWTTGVKATDCMKGWLDLITEPVITAINVLELLVIVAGTVEVLGKLVRAAIRPLTDRERRDAGLRYVHVTWGVPAPYNALIRLLPGGTRRAVRSLGGSEAAGCGRPRPA